MQPERGQVNAVRAQADRVLPIQRTAERKIADWAAGKPMSDEEVAAIVEDCSDSILEAGEEKEDWWKRKIKYIKQLPKKSKSSLRVVIADKLHNCRSIYRDFHEATNVLQSLINAM